jgi:hypothetical protein
MIYVNPRAQTHIKIGHDHFHIICNTAHMVLPIFNTVQLMSWNLTLINKKNHKGNVKDSEQRRISFAFLWHPLFILKRMLLEKGNMSEKKSVAKKYERQSKSSRKSLTSKVWCTTYSNSLDSVTGNIYVQVLHRLHGAVRRERGDKWHEQWFLHRNNAPSHTSPVVQKFLAEKNIPVIIETPYSPVLARRDFWLLLILKKDLKGKRFATKEIKSSAMAKLCRIPEEAFRRCFQQWQYRWSKCVCVRACECVHCGPSLMSIWYALPYVLPLQCNTSIPGTFRLSIIYTPTLKLRRKSHYRVNDSTMRMVAEYYDITVSFSFSFSSTSYSASSPPPADATVHDGPCLFYNFSALVPISSTLSPISNVHCIQIFFIRIQPPARVPPAFYKGVPAISPVLFVTSLYIHYIIYTAHGCTLISRYHFLQLGHTFFSVSLFQRFGAYLLLSFRGDILQVHNHLI